MRILLINKYHFLKGGAERAYFDMARILVSHGHKVAYFSMHHEKNLPTLWEPYFVESVDYGRTDLPFVQKLRMAGRILWNNEANHKLENLLREFHPDIAHAHNIYHQLSPSILWTLKKHHVPIVMTLHDYKVISPNYSLFVRGKIWDHVSGLRCMLDRCVKDSFSKSLVCALEQWLHQFIGSYKFVHIFVSPSIFLRDKFREHGFAGRIEYLPNCLSPAIVTTEKYKDAANQHNFLFFGRLSAEKAVEVLIQAFVVLPEEMTLDLVGDGPDRKRLEELVSTLGLTKRVHFHGLMFGDELERLKRQSFAVLIPSAWYENFPYVITESLQSGCLLIAARIGGIPERIVDTQNGFLFQAGSAESLVEVIQKLPQYDLSAIRKNAIESVADLSEEIFYKRLSEMYGLIIQS